MNDLSIDYFLLVVKKYGGQVDRVDYLGGATFATKENAGKRNGVSLGNYININISDEITGSFQDRVLSDPLFMHEFGHTFDSRTFGFTYLFAVGALVAYHLRFGDADLHGGFYPPCMTSFFAYFCSP